MKIILHFFLLELLKIQFFRPTASPYSHRIMLGTQAAFDIPGCRIIVELTLIVQRQSTLLILSQNTMPFMFRFQQLLSLILHISQANVVIYLPVKRSRHLIAHNPGISCGVCLHGELVFLPECICLYSLGESLTRSTLLLMERNVDLFVFGAV